MVRDERCVTGKIFAMRNRALSVAASVLLLAVLAPSVPAETVNAAGTWVSTASVGSEKEGAWQLNATVSDDAISGSFSTTGPCDVAEGGVFGTYAAGGGDIHFGILYNDVEEATFNGTVEGVIASGTYTTRKGDSGNWTGSLGGPPK